MNNQDKSKEDIIEIVNDFRNNYQNYKKLTEPDVETKLVEELFIKVLGWDKKDFIKREKAHREGKRGIADYAFYINDKIVFFLEVKGIGVPLDKEADKQVISYALSRRVPLAISTNFEQMNIFCVEQENALKNVFRTFKTLEDYVNNFSDLWFLSKESFEQGLLLKKAEDERRLKRRITINKPLLEDFMRIRSLIANDIEKRYTGKYNINEKDEIVQRILDRLIFIRRCEDVGINPDNLVLEEIKHISDTRAYSQLKTIFAKYDAVYNSGLFTPNIDNDCDKITIEGEIIKKLVYYLYESHDKEYIYDFEWIDADVLGQVYEQYLGKILAQTKSGKAKLKVGQAHRKEQGIYYTPTYIVDYIVKNTVSELLKDKKIDVKKIKILDPACGSGSFLIKAFDYMQKNLANGEEALQHRLDSQGSYSIKTEILKNNLFGVDLDNKAVEITKLNLLLKAAEKFRKLPKELDNHICWGNSLIEDDSVSEHAFKWVGEFQEGTFDVVIGNPPYVDIKQLDPKIVKYLFENYNTVENRMNLYSTFVEKSLSLLKEGGYFGFIIPNSILYNESYTKIRKLLLSNTNLKKIVRLPDNVFEGVKIETVILIYKKTQKKKLEQCEVYLYPRDITINAIKEDNCPKITHYNQSIWETENYNFNITINPIIKKILTKIEEKNTNLIEICDFSLGLTPYDKYKGHSEQQIKNQIFHSSTKKNDTFKPLLSGENIVRYGIFWDKKQYISYGNWLGAPREKRFFTNPHIVVRQIISGKPPRIYAGYTDEELYNAQIGFNILSKDETKVKIRYILAILNSKLMTYHHKEKYLDPTKNLFQKILIANAKKFPIKILPISEQDRIIHFVDKMLSLNKRLKDIGDKKTAQTAKLEEEIDRTDQEIDELIYELYGITDEEKKIIEESLR